LLKFVITITEADMNEIKRLDQLCMFSGNTFLAATAFAKDSAGNTLDTIAISAAMPVQSYESDSTHPTITSFTLNLNSAEIVLSFSETMRATTLNISQFTLQSKANCSLDCASFQLDVTTNPSENYAGHGLLVDTSISPHGRVFVIRIGLTDLNMIKFDTGLAISIFTTYLQFSNFALSDMFGNDVFPVHASDALGASSFSPDVTAPLLSSFEFAFIADSLKSALTLSFTETVRSRNLNLSYFTLQSNGSDDVNNTVVLREGSWSIVDSTSILITLSSHQTNEIKLTRPLARGYTSLFLSIAFGGITDMSDNGLLPIFGSTAQAVKAGKLTLDITSPRLMNFSLDMDKGWAVLGFDEPIDVLTVRTSFIFFGGSNTSNNLLQLVGGSHESMNSVFVTVKIVKNDIDRIKVAFDKCTNVFNSFVTLVGNSFEDMFGNDIDTTNLAAYQFQPDITSPNIVSFTSDMTIGTLRIYFDEAVRIPSLKSSGLCLQSEKTFRELTLSYCVSEGISNSLNWTVMDFVLDRHDLDIVNSQLQLFVANESSYVRSNEVDVSIPNAGFEAPGIDFKPVHNWTQMSSTTVRNDNVGGCCQMGAFTMTPFGNSFLAITKPGYAYITLTSKIDIGIYYFSAYINEDVSVSLGSTVIQLSIGCSVNEYVHVEQFRGASINSAGTWDCLNCIPDFNTSSWSRIETMIRIDKLNSCIDYSARLMLKMISLSGRIGVDNVELRRTAPDFVTDMNGNPLKSIRRENAMRTSSFMLDVDQPRLLSFHLNMDTSLLTLNMHKAVNNSATLVQFLTLQNAQFSPSQTHTLTSSTISSSVNSNQINISLSKNDMDALKLKRIGRSAEVVDTWLMMESAAVRGLQAQFSVQATIYATSIERDIHPPSLTEFNFNLNVMQLTMFFSEPVDASSFQVAQISLQGASSNGAENHSLTLSSTLAFGSVNGLQLTINLGLFDTNRIKQLSHLASSEFSTFISVTEWTIHDMAFPANNIVAIPSQIAKRVWIFTQDATPPLFLNFVRFDLHNETMRLKFDETVNASTLWTAGITLQNSVTSPTEFYALTNGWTTTVFDSVVDIKMSHSDVNAIKMRTDLCTSTLNCYLFLQSYAISDMVGLSLGTSMYGLQLEVGGYVPDDIHPTLLNFAFSMNDGGLITLTFDETVLASSLDASKLSFSTLLLLPMNTYNLTGSLPYNQDDSTILEIYLLKIDLDALKIIYGEAILAGSSLGIPYINPSRDSNLSTSSAVTDMFGNFLVSAPVGPALFTGDTTNPTVDSFSLDMDALKLVLYFSEPVFTNVDISKITFQSKSSSSSVPLQIYQLTSGTLSNIHNSSSAVNIFISSFDAAQIKGKLGLCKNKLSTYLSIATGLTVDMTNINPTTSISKFAAMIATMFTADSTPPWINNISFDMNTGIILLEFSEFVSELSLNKTFSFSNNIDESYNKTVSHTAIRSGYVFSYQFSNDDLNVIKSKQICYSAKTCFVTVKPLWNDAFDNLLVVSPMAVDKLVVDVTAPKLVLFSSCNRDSGMIELSFSETVNISSVVFTLITLFDDFESATSSLSLTSYQHTTFTTNGPNLRFSLSDKDIYNLDTVAAICTSKLNCWVTVDVDGIMDMQGNYAVTNYPLRVRTFSVSVTRPRLLNFILDMNDGSIDMFFDKVIDVDSIISAGLVLQEGVSSNLYTIQSLTSSSPNSNNITVVLSPQDVLALKSRTLCKSFSNTYLSLSSAFISDVTLKKGNAVVPILSSSPLQTLSYRADIVGPSVVAFSLNLVLNQLIIVANEPMNISAMINSGIYLNLSGLVVKLSSGTPVEGYGSVQVTINLASEDLLQLKLQYRVSPASSMLAVFPGGTIFDTTNVPNLEQLNLVGTVVADSNAPKLLSSMLNMTSMTMSLVFDDVIDFASVDPSKLILLHKIGSDVIFTPKNSTCVSANTYTVIIGFSLFDSNTLKSLYNLATSDTTVVTSLRAEFARGINGVNIIAVIVASPMYTSFYPDTISPALQSFDLDMNSLHLSLHFSETINVSSFDVSNLIISFENASVLLTGFVSKEVPTLGKLVIVLTKLDADDIKKYSYLAKSVNSTMLSILPGAIKDMNRNMVTKNLMLPVTTYTADTTSPVLISFIVDLTAEQLILSFNEPVNAASLIMTAFTFVKTKTVLFSSQLSSNTFSETQVDLTYSLTGGFTVSENGLKIICQLTEFDLNKIKSKHPLASSGETTLLAYIDSAILDMAAIGNKIEPSPSALIQSKHILNFVADHEDPVLRAFDLDLDSKTLTMSFSETINSSSLNVSKLILWSKDNPFSITGQMFQFTNAELVHVTNPTNLPTITFQLTLADLNAIKLLRSLAKSTNSTYLQIEVGAVRDLNGNSVMDEWLNVRSYQSDTTSPTLVSYNINANFSPTKIQLSLFFDEPIDFLSVNLNGTSGLYLVGSTVFPNFGPNSMTISTGLSSTVDATSITVIITVSDSNRFKANEALLKSSDCFDSSYYNYTPSCSASKLSLNAGTFIELLSTFCDDTNGNDLVAVTKQISHFSRDLTAPTLTSSSIDMSTGVLLLTFSESILSNSLTISNLSVASSQAVNADFVQLTLSHLQPVTYVNSWTLQITISNNDMNSIKAVESIARSANSTNLFFGNHLVTDSSSNRIHSVPLEDALPSLGYMSDFVSPKLLLASLNMLTGQLQLSFDETIDTRTFKTENIILYNGNGTIYTLMSGMSLSAPTSNWTRGNELFSDTILISFNQSQLNALKLPADIARSQDDTFVSIGHALVRDMFSNDVMNISQDNYLKVRVLLDNLLPIITSGSIDLSTSQLYFSFDEVISYKSIKAEKIAIVFGLYKYILTSSTLTNRSTDGISIIIGLTLADKNAIQLMFPLAIDLITTEFLLYNGFVTDTSIIPNALASTIITCTAYVRDDIKPELISFAYNEQLQTITLLFSKVVNASSLKSSAIQLSDSVSGMPYILTGGTTNSSNGLQITVQLLLTDMNEIKARSPLFKEIQYAYLTIGLHGLADMAGNFIDHNPAILATSVILSSDFPYLLGYSLDMNTGIVVLTFDETVNGATLDASAFTFQSSSLISSAHVTLHGGFSLTNILAPVQSFKILDSDMNEIKRLRIANNIATTWLTVTASGIQDTNNKMLTPRLTDLSSLAVLGPLYVPDTTPPKLLNFSFDLTTNYITLVFSETVLLSSISVAAFTLQSHLNISTIDAQSYSFVYALDNLGGTCFSQPNDNTTIFVSLVACGASPYSSYDLNSIKQLLTLAKSNSNTYLSMTVDAVTDMASLPNKVLEISTSNALQVTLFTPDTASPSLVAFSLNLHSRVLTAFFDESVNTSSIRPSSITLQNKKIADIDSEAVVLTASSYLNSSDGKCANPLLDCTIVVIQICVADFNKVKKFRNLCTSATDCFIVINSGLINDVSAHAVHNITSNNALPILASGFSADDVKPILMSFDLDMNNSILRLTFDETVKASTLMPAAVTIFAGAYNFKLTGGWVNSLTSTAGVDSSFDSTVQSITILKTDLDAIKFNNNNADLLAVSPSSTFLLFESFGIEDMTLNTVATTNIAVTEFKPDVTKPVITQYDFDGSMSVIGIQFSEPVFQASVNVTAITLSDSAAGNNTFTLSSSSYIYFTSRNSLNIILSVQDHNALKFKRIALTAATCWLSVQSPYEFITDMVHLALVTSTRLEPTNFTIDNIPPQMTSYALDMNGGQMSAHSAMFTFYFDEPILVSSFMVSKLILLLTSSSPTTNETLISAMPLSGDLVQQFNFSLDKLVFDRIEAKLIAKSHDLTFLLISENAFYDASGIGNIGVSAKPILAANYVADTTLIALTRFDLDLTFETLSLHFSKAVDSSHILVTEISLQNYAYAPLVAFKLTGMSGAIEVHNSTTVFIKLTIDDLNAIKMLPALATSSKNSYLSISDSGAFDLALFANHVIAISNHSSLPVSLFTADNVDPVLQSFDLNMQLEQITFTFSETVNASSLYAAVISIQSENVATATTEMFTFNVGSTLAVFDKIVLVQLSHADIILMTVYRNLCTNYSNCFLTTTTSLIADMAGNNVVAIPSSDALVVNNFTKDKTSPIMISFNLSMNGDGTTCSISLSFDETIKISTLLPVKITIATNLTTPFSSHTLTGGYLTPGMDATSTSFQLIKTDVDAIKLIVGLAVDRTSSFLVFETGTITDMAGNALQGGAVGPAILYTRDIFSPNLVGFAVNMNTLLLSISFDEPINISSIVPQCVTLSETSDGLNSIKLNSSKVVTSAINAAIIVINISIVDANRIKSVNPLATSIPSSWLQLQSCFAVDMARNILVSSSNIQATYYSPDVTNPNFISFDMNMNTHHVKVTFDEPVNISTFQNAVELFSDNTNDYLSADYFSFAASTFTLTDILLDKTVFIFLIDEVSINMIKMLTTLARNSSTTYLGTSTAFVADMVSNNVNAVGLTPASRLQVKLFVPDTTKPMIRSFDLDLHTSILTISFSETVLATSVKPSLFAIERGYDIHGFGVSLTNSTVLSVKNGPIQTILISSIDLNIIKAKDGHLADSASSTQLYMASAAVSDINGNTVDTVTTQCSNTACVYTPDSNSPVAIEVDINMNSNIVGILFNETVDAATLQVSKITFYSVKYGTSWSLTTSTVTISNSPYIVINISFVDLNMMLLRSLCRELSDTTVSFSWNVVKDTAFAPNSAIASILLPRNLQSSTTAPVLFSFDVDMNLGIVLLSFQEVVNASSLDATTLTFSSAGSNIATSYTIVNGWTTSINDFSFVVQLSVDDLNNMKKLSVLCTSANSCFLTTVPALIRSMTQIPSVATQLMKASGFGVDQIHPEISSFGIDMEGKKLHINFSRTVNISTLITSLITLQRFSDRNEQGLVDGVLRSSFYTLTSAVPESWLANVQVTLQLSDIDVNALNKLHIARTLQSTWLSTESNAIRSNSNKLPLRNQFNSSYALNATTYVADVTNPVLLSFDVSMNAGPSGAKDAGYITLTFSEVVDYHTFNIPSIMIAQDASGLPSFSFSASTSVYTTAYSTTVTIFVAITDANLIKALDNLYRSLFTSYLSAAANGVKDMFGNGLIYYPYTVAGVFIADTTAPELIAFDIDQSIVIKPPGSLNYLQTMSITLIFSETIRKNTFSPTGLQIQSAVSTVTGVQFLRLTGLGEIINTSTSSLVSISFKLTYEDSNNIKLKPLLSKKLDKTDTWASVFATLVKDMSNNSVAIIPTSSAQNARTYHSDEQNPGLLSFALNLSSGTITMVFDEPMRGYSLVPSEITLQDALGSSLDQISTNITLTGGYGVGRTLWIPGSFNTFSNPDGTVVSVTMLLTDLNRLKRSHFCTNSDDCYLVHSALLIQDLAGLYIASCK